MRSTLLAVLCVATALSAHADWAPDSLAGITGVSVVSNGSGWLANYGGYRLSATASGATVTPITSNIMSQNGTYRYLKVDATHGLVIATDDASGFVAFENLTFTSASSAGFSIRTFNPGTGARTGVSSITMSSSIAGGSAVVSYRDNITGLTATHTWILANTSGSTTSNAGLAGTQWGTFVIEASGSRLVNIASRAKVETGDDILIAGFVITNGPKRVLIRATGPGLTALGVPGALADPRLEVYTVRGVLIASNDNWTDAELATTAATVGAQPFAVGSRDAALLITLDAGAYSAQVKGVGGGTGVSMVEVYDAP